MNEEERRRRVYGCIEIAASLVCCTDVQLGWFGEIGELTVLSDHALDMPLARGHSADGDG